MKEPLSYISAMEILSDIGKSHATPYWNFKNSTEKLDISEAVGRILAQKVFSPEEVPSFDNSSMDGFAVRSEETRNASPEHPVLLEVRGCIAAGDSGHFSLPEFRLPNSAIEIMTGAPMPSCYSPAIVSDSPSLGFHLYDAVPYDAVIKIEDVEIRKDSQEPNRSTLWIRKPVRSGENIRYKGQDFQIGLPIGTPGQVFGPETLMAFACLGVSEVQVLRRPRVAILSTGRELVSYRRSSEQTLKPGTIRNSTAPYLESALKILGAQPHFYGTIVDSEKDFLSSLSQILDDSPDILLTTGAVSMGKYDFVLNSLRQVGAEILFHKVSIRPGKPILFARMENGPVIFGIPGNPISTAVALRFFIEPYLRILTGRTPEVPLRAKLSETVPKPEGLRCFYKARLKPSSQFTEIPEVEVLPGQASFQIKPLLHSNAWVVLDEAGTHAKAGRDVLVYPLLPGQGFGGL